MMHRPILLVLSLLLGVFPPILLEMEAQKMGDKRHKFLLGPTAGLNLSRVIFVPSIPQTDKVGFDAGLVLRYDVESYAGLWLEVDYSSRGWKEAYEEHPDLRYERTLNYLNLPFMTHFMIGRGAFKITIDAGPQFGYLISESSRDTFAGSDPANIHTHQHGLGVERKIAWGLGGGPGIEYHTKRVVGGVRLAYYYGLGDFYNNTRNDYFGKSSEQIYSAKAYVLFSF